MKNWMTEMKKKKNNTLEGIHSRLEEAGEWISELEDRVMESYQAKE